MSLDDLTHVWVEAPFSSNSLKVLPESVVILQAEPSPSQRTANAAPAQVIFASSGVRYDAALFEQLSNLRMVIRTGIGVDNVTLADATQHGVIVCNTPDGPTESTAEHTVAMILNLAKRIKQGNDNLAQGRFGPRSEPLVGMEVREKTVGLIGLGRIGRRVAQICHNGFDMQVIAYDPYVTPEQVAGTGVKLVGLSELLQNSDFVSLHAPVTPDTLTLMNSERIGQMKDGAYLLNLARGPLLDPDTLIEALDNGKLAGAGLDVFEPEPPEIESPLRNHPLILATPHGATLTVEGRVRIENMAVERALIYFGGERPPDVVNPAVFKSAALRR